MVPDLPFFLPQISVTIGNVGHRHEGKTEVSAGDKTITARGGEGVGECATGVGGFDGDFYNDLHVLHLD